jgi:hypothetical protein
MPVLDIRGIIVSFPEHYREWSLEIDRDIYRRAYLLHSRATDTSGERHGCETRIDEDFLIYSRQDTEEIFARHLEMHFADIDNYSRRLAARGITLRPRFASGGYVRSEPAPIGLASPTFVGLDFGRLEQTVMVSRRSIPRVAEGTLDPELMFPPEFQQEPPNPAEPPKQEEPVKEPRKRLSPKPPSDSPAQLSVKPKPRKLRL